MTKNLVIVESPSKSKTIEKYLGKDYKAEPNTIYVLNSIEDNKKQELSNILSTPLMEMMTVKDEETANQIKEQMMSNIP